MRHTLQLFHSVIDVDQTSLDEAGMPCILCIGAYHRLMNFDFDPKLQSVLARPSKILKKRRCGVTSLDVHLDGVVCSSARFVGRRCIVAQMLT